MIFTPLHTEGVSFESSATLFLEETHYALRTSGIMMAPCSHKIKASNLTYGFMFTIITNGQEHDKLLEIHVNKFGNILCTVYFLNPTSQKWEETDSWEDFLSLPNFIKKFPQIIEDLK